MIISLGGHKRAATHALQCNRKEGKKERKKEYSLRESKFHVSYTVLALERVSAAQQTHDNRPQPKRINNAS